MQPNTHDMVRLLFLHNDAEYWSRTVYDIGIQLGSVQEGISISPAQCQQSNKEHEHHLTLFNCSHFEHFSFVTSLVLNVDLFYYIISFLSILNRDRSSPFSFHAHDQPTRIRFQLSYKTDKTARSFNNLSKTVSVPGDLLPETGRASNVTAGKYILICSMARFVWSEWVRVEAKVFVQELPAGTYTIHTHMYRRRECISMIVKRFVF